MSSLLSHCALFLRNRLVLSDHVDVSGTKLYPQSFTIRELKNALQSFTSRRAHWQSSISSNVLIEAMVTTLEMQMFFYNATWKPLERATDDDICILLRCDTYEHQSDSPRPHLGSSTGSNGAFTSASAPALASEPRGAIISPITGSPIAQRPYDTDSTCLPTGVMPSLSKCYSSTCDESYPCYSFSCPNRNKKKKFTVQCYSNSCGSGYGCYSPTCPCRYENDTEAEIDDPSTAISVEVKSPIPIPGQPKLKSIYDLPKLLLNATTQAPASSNTTVNRNIHSPLISPATTTLSTYSFSSSLTPSSPYTSLSPVSPFSPMAQWDPSSSPIDISASHDIGVDSATRPPVPQTLPRIHTHFPYTNSYQDSNPTTPSPYYVQSPAGLSTPLSPNWEPILLISMIGPSITWVSRERSSSSVTPTPAYTGGHQPNHSPVSHSLSHTTPRPFRPFSSILKSYMGDNDTQQNAEAELVSPTTPYSPYSPYPLSPF